MKKGKAKLRRPDDDGGILPDKVRRAMYHAGVQSTLVGAPSNRPKKIHEFAWWYEDKGGIVVVTEARTPEGAHLATEQARITWTALFRAMERCHPITRMKRMVLDTLAALRNDEWRVTVDWGPREERDAILASVDAILKAHGIRKPKAGKRRRSESR